MPTHLEAALEEHQRWVDRLRRYGLGDSSARLDAESICHADQCALSHWLQTHPTCAPGWTLDLQQIAKEHADFHAKAAVVVAMMEVGAVESALLSVQYGDFAQISARLTQHLQALRAAWANGEII